MRETLLILVVVGILLAITAVRYRRQINGIIGFARMLKDAKDAARVPNMRTQQPQARSSVQLVNCSKCGVWVPENKALQRGRLAYCERCA
ncbi:MAG TPA: hypothetical protein VL501_01515 [Pyrinomonadaceae bacterium]|nr:hypothetical protein [Pyrinomonadaceae bacterium]